MKIHELKPRAGSKFRKKIIGRGNGSGHGTYSTKGMKGQKARSGFHIRPGFEGGQTPIITLTPKLRGFQSIYEKPAVLNLDDLQKHFKNNDKITKRILFEKGLIKSANIKVKILGSGELTKKLTIEADSFSKSAKGKIEKVGGKAVIIKTKEQENLPRRQGGH